MQPKESFYDTGLVGVYTCKQMLENIWHCLARTNISPLKDPENNAEYTCNNFNINSVHYCTKKKQSKNWWIFVVYSHNVMLHCSENEWKTATSHMSLKNLIMILKLITNKKSN